MAIAISQQPWRQVMRFSQIHKAILALSLLGVINLATNSLSLAAHAQTAVTGALSGVVADPTGGVVPKANVVITDSATDAKVTAVTNAEGHYTVGLMKPGLYKITASAAELKSDTVEVTVILGTTVTADITVTPTGTSTIVEVKASDLPLVDTQNVALATTFTEQQIQDLPAPGGDVTTLAFTAPGVVVNAGGMYGNFSSDGLPGISNLFVLNGFDNQDPFLNLNNSGSSNLTLGQGELADATVVQNGYNSQYGRAAGAILNYTTKSGGNRFHGEAVYDYNGTLLNANGWFNNDTGNARPHAVSNEWALNGGGPIIKDKVFFFSDYEGLHYVLPNSGFVSLPSSQYEAYALATVPASAVSTYNQMFGLYNNAPSYASATPVPTVAGASPTNPGGGCGSLSGASVPGSSDILGQNASCALNAYGQANNINVEWLFTQRVDWNLNDKHKIYGRYKMDHGSQPTNTNFVDPAFNVLSIQPEYEGQFNDSYIITPNLINSAVVAANWYTAYFGPASIPASQAVLPFFALFGIGADGSGTSEQGGFSNLGLPFFFPQGRNVTQYQLEEDLSWTHGRSSFKFGANFRRDDVEDFDAQVETDFPLLEMFSLSDIAQGSLCTGSSSFCNSNLFQQAFVPNLTAHLALYNIGMYAEDEWQVIPRLKLTLGARVDRTGPPLCHDNCFSLYQGGFPNSSASLTEPYASEINPSNAHPFGVDAIEFQPRFGFNYQLDGSTVIRGGAGLFADLYPSVFLDAPIQNFPNANTETLLAGNIASSGSGSMYANAAGGNSAVTSGFATGTVTSLNNSLTALGIPFSPPSLLASFSGTFHQAQYLEYSMQIQRQLSSSDGLSFSYAGNYGYNELIQNPFLNGATGGFNNATGTWTSLGTLGNLPVTPPDPSFGEVNAYSNNAHSNYSGAMLTYTHQGHGLISHFSYTYSHALDMASNGGVGTAEPYNSGTIAKQLTPSLGPGNLNYSNADYDIRNNLVGDVVYEERFKVQNRIVNTFVSGWTIAGKTYYRSGEPFSVVNSNLIAGFPALATIGGTSLMPQATGSNLTNTCGSNPHAAVTSACLDSTQYVGSTQTTFGNLRRNAFYGPHYANTDATLSKQIVRTEGVALTLGAQAYNIFNHPNFSNPNATLGDGNFGSITGIQAPPTSPYGSFQGAAVTQRVLVVTGKISF
jgi:outer membrane receptor protein involved in Fe transport